MRAYVVLYSTWWLSRSEDYNVSGFYGLFMGLDIIFVSLSPNKKASQMFWQIWCTDYFDHNTRLHCVTVHNIICLSPENSTALLNKTYFFNSVAIPSDSLNQFFMINTILCTVEMSTYIKSFFVSLGILYLGHFISISIFQLQIVT